MLFDNYLVNILLFLILSCSQILFIYFYSKIAFKINLIDFPTDRKLHKGEIPLVGGISIYSSLFLFFIFFDTNYFHKIIFISSLIIFVVSLYDDIFDIGITERIFFQTIACLIVVGFGIKIYDLGDYLNLTISLGGFGIVLSCITIIAYTNAINFSDGLDGLAAGYILNCLFSIILFSIFYQNYNDLKFLIFLSLLICIFLFSNLGVFLPKTFLGDNGSASLGFLVSCYLIYFTMPDNRHFHPVLALWAASFPTFDFLTVFIRRLLKKINPFKPDRRHLHYLLIKSKLENKYIPLILVSSSMISSVLGLVTLNYFGSINSLVFFFFCFIFYFLISVYVSRENN